MSTTQFVRVRFIATGATGTVPEDNLAYFLARGYELITDEEAVNTPFPYVRKIGELAGIVTAEDLATELAPFLGEASAASDSAVATQVTSGPLTIAAFTAKITTGVDDATALDKLRGLYRPQASQLRRVRANLARAAAGQGFARLAFLGDSTVAGYGATPQTSWPNQLREALATAGYPINGSGFVPMNKQMTDSRWTLVDWNPFAGVESSAYASTTTTPAVFMSDKPGTTVRVYYLQSNGPFSVAIDGGAPVTVTPTGASAIGEYSVAGLGNTTHTVSIARTSAANAIILGVEVLNAASPTGVRIANVGVNGSKASDIDKTASGDWYKHIKFIRDQWNADCTFIMCETNDAFAGTSVAAYKADMMAIVQACQTGSRDVVLLTTFPASTVPSFTAYTQALYEVAVARNCVLIDVQSRMGDWATANSYGQMADAAHPNAAGYRAAALAVLGLLTS